MANLTVQGLSGGLVPTMVAADAAGDSAPVGGSNVIMVTNDDASGKTVTVPKARDTVRVQGFGELQTDDIVVSIAAGETALIFAPPNTHGSGGRATINYDDVTSVTVAVLKVGG